MHVVAMAGHVDHGKSTLVRALTGTEPDRWAEERRRGLTIDLGFAWLDLAQSGAGGTGAGEAGVVGFVDVPGHQRFIGNMLAGLGPAPAVMFVVAADDGWGRQSTEHLAAVDALGLTHGLLVITRSDLADPGPALDEARDRLRGTTLQDVPAVTVSAFTGQGLDELRGALRTLVDALPAPEVHERLRLWVDRVFTVRGSGTVVTGTLGAGTLRTGDELELLTPAGPMPARVRGLQSRGSDRETVPAVARVAVNLRGVPADKPARGDTLLTPGTWHLTRTVDARLATGQRQARDLPGELVLHVGSVAVPAHVRPLADDTCRLTLTRSLPLVAGDRAILRDPGRQQVLAGLVLLDVDPPALTRRGAARARAAALDSAGGVPDLTTELVRRGSLRTREARALGIPVEQLATPDPGAVTVVGDWLVHPAVWRRWAAALDGVSRTYAAEHPLEPAIPMEQARRAAGVPDLALLETLAAAAGLRTAGGRVSVPGTEPSLGAAEPAVQALEQRLSADPFAAPGRDELAAAGLGNRQLAAAVRAGRLLRLAGDVVLLPGAPQEACQRLAGLPQPFTTSQARQVLATSRRVAIPLLEHLDELGLTLRHDDATRTTRH